MSFPLTVNAYDIAANLYADCINQANALITLRADVNDMLDHTHDITGQVRRSANHHVSQGVKDEEITRVIFGKIEDMYDERMDSRTPPIIDRNNFVGDVVNTIQDGTATPDDNRQLRQKIESYFDHIFQP